MDQAEFADKIIQKDPLVKRPKLYQRIFKFRTLLLMSFPSFLFLAFMARIYPYFPFDLYITRSIQQINHPWFDSWMRFATILGNIEWGVFMVALIAIFLMLVRRLHEALLVVISTMGIGVVSVFLKALIARPRPDAELINQIGIFKNPDSFPSGHVLHYIGLYGFLVFLAFTELKRSLVRTVIISVFTILLASIGLSRIYLGAHWFSDTLGSYLVGIIWLYFMVFLFRKLKEKSKTV